MAGSFKTLDPANDIVSTRTLLHEAIPLTGTIVSGTYNNLTTEYNIKNFSHGMFQSVYDYPYLSSSANHIFDITIGCGAKSNIYSDITSQKSKKNNVYNQLAQVLVGYDHTGSIQEFDEDGNIVAGGTKLRDVFFMNFSRLLVKDEIKKGSFTLEMGITSAYAQDGSMMNNRIKIVDVSGSAGYFVNSPAGEYGILYATGSTLHANSLPANQYYPCGVLYYQAGIAVISGSIFNDADDAGILNTGIGTSVMHTGFAADGFNHITGSEISASADYIRSRIYNVQFNNTTELNSTIYFCRANHHEFNYSSNPTYLSGSKIRVKTQASDNPVSYITTVGLYGDDNELLAVAKLSEPLKKSSDTEYTIRTRLDY
jgi:hypothetical protein